MTLPSPGFGPPTMLFEALPVMPTPSHRLPSGACPVASVPMRLPWTTLSEVPASEIPTPAYPDVALLPEMTFPAPAAGPPIVLPVEPPQIPTPSRRLPTP